ncbi:acyltransferase family protein [Methylobacterium sp. M6A4_1b]
MNHSNAFRAPSTGPTKQRDLSLDLVRGIAILLAMGWHFNAAYDGGGFASYILAPGRTLGWAGVDLFFVLSGFLIGKVVFSQYLRDQRFDFGRFMVRRALRLWPVCYLYLAAQLVVGDKQWDTYLFQNLFHVQNYTGSSLNHLWSLAVEEHFYLLLAALMAFATHRRPIDPKFILIILASIIFVSPVLRAAAVVLGVDPVAIQWQTHYRADALACGVALAVMSTFYGDAFCRLLAYRPVWFGGLLVGTIGLWLLPHRSATFSILGYSLAAFTGVCFLLAVYKAAFIARMPGLFRPLAYIGFISYPIYVWHISMTKLIAIGSAKLGLNLSETTILFGEYLGAIGLGAILTFALERPIIAWRDRYFPQSDTGLSPTKAEGPQPASAKP